MNIHTLPSLDRRLLVLITSSGVEKRLGRILAQLKLKLYWQCRGHGTASSELLDVCGLDGTARLVTAALLPGSQVPRVLETLSGRLALRRQGGGIALTIPVDGLQASIQALLAEDAAGPQSEEKEELPLTKHAMILVAANYGCSEEILQAARGAGARGGTILRGRRGGEAAALGFLGMSTQEEQEFLMIVVPQAKKAAVMAAVSGSCGLTSPARGVVLSIPVEDALGLEGG